MSETANLITLEQGAEFAGVSPETIKQYAKFGLLNSVDKEGASYFKKDEIETLFYVSGRKTSTTKSATKQPAGTTPETKTEAQPSATTGAAKQATQQDDTEQPLQQTVSEQINPAQPNIVVEKVVTPNAVNEVEGINTLELIEITRSLREQVQMLKEERDWLRDRLEKMESRSEREQMLLLSESETIRRLVSQTVKPKFSFWNLALPWLKGEKPQ